MKADLLEVISRFKDVPMLVVGDLILDHYIWGKVSRISPEAPVVVVKTTKETRTPGGAANVVNNLTKLGSKVSVSGLIGEDEFGRILSEQLSELGADVEGVFSDSSRSTTSKSRVIAHAQQVVRVDREETTPYSDEIKANLSNFLSARLSESQGLVISDYAKGVVSESLFKPLVAAKEAGSIGLNIKPVVVDPKAPNYSFYAGTSVIKPNRSEAEDASGQEINSLADAEKAARILLEKWDSELILITLGEDGMLFASAQECQTIPTQAREVYDVSGAGDTVSAVFALSLAVKATPLQAAILSNIAAGVVVAEVGTVPITTERLVQAVEKGDL